eukprot:8570151-Pyramimonas_sp.AAC.1
MSGEAAAGWEKTVLSRWRPGIHVERGAPLPRNMAMPLSIRRDCSDCLPAANHRRGNNGHRSPRLCQSLLHTPSTDG